MPEDVCCRDYCAFFDAADQRYDVAAPTGGKAIPYPAGKMNPEGGGVVAAVKGAWTDQLVATVFESGAKTVGLEHPADVHLLFEVCKELCAHGVYSCHGRYRGGHREWGGYHKRLMARLRCCQARCRLEFNPVRRVDQCD